MPVLVQLEEQSETEDLTQRRDELYDEIKRITNGVAEAGLDKLRRFVAANLTTNEIAELRHRYEELKISRVWKNGEKRALLDVSAHRIQAYTARLGYKASGKGIHWAVLDTGINASHPHFKRHENIAATWNCTLPGEPVQDGATDGTGHGTHVAGIIAGIEDANGDPPDRGRYDGIAPEAKLHIYKVLDDAGRGQDSWIIKALDHIAQTNEKSPELKIHGVNLSLGGPFDADVYGCGHSPLCRELRRLWRMGVVACVAAGNEGVLTVQSFGASGPQRQQLTVDLSIGDPANLEEAIAVGSINKEFPHTYGVSYFSSRGPTADGRVKPDLVAPGEQVNSCNARYTPGVATSHYIPMSGTSMACPHVSGLLAGFLSVRGEFIGRPDEVKRFVLKHATDLGRAENHQGRGMPNLVKMLAET
jgi:subtilisin family serine protease